MSAPQTYCLNTEQLRETAPQLRAGDRVILSGTIYTARDAAHKRIFAMLDEGKQPPFPIRDAVIYYAGPTPAQQGMAVGACGPTTSSRMNGFAPRLLDLGLAGIIGKGQMDDQVRAAIVRNGACYFAAVGGAGALIARCIQRAEVIAFDDLGCESVKRMTVQNFPLTVAMDAAGNSLYETGREAYRIQ
ncbi:MAG: FumA C-terminus/TtdB family hydratase beta subunit [Clostridiales bacterium]|nr:FumA C-terminus/TtdB family hydratase beta subunit [Clostridiales bacterium]